jgi:hypothetical protein
MRLARAVHLMERPHLQRQRQHRDDDAYYGDDLSIQIQ